MNIKITNGFWGERLEVNARRAIFHQWEQLQSSGCIENFRIAAGDVEGLRIGWFFADSDAYKWLDAAARIYRSFPDPRLASLMDDLIALIGRAQQPDGYIFTYNQIHFPGTRWVNLQIEHELYCHGHLIEAGVAHHAATGRSDLLEIACRAANRIVEDFRGKGPAHTPGHEEIEIALIKLHQLTQQQAYLDMARQFIEQRGRNPFFAFSILRQNSSVARRIRFIQQQKEEYLAAHPEYKPYPLPPGNVAKEPSNARLRRTLSGLSGNYVQQHAPVRKQTVPVGHSVRFGYFETATAMLARASGDETLLPALMQAWDHMVARRMYVTGGIGSAPSLEGFGNDYELDPEYAYAETCAALASMFWSWEMAQVSNQARYSDLFEWQLYNAAAVGMGTEGTTYLYNNPLTCQGGVTRKPWYAVPCCPSNISRTWADLGKYVYSTGPGELRIHQYINAQLQNQPIKLDDGSEITISLEMNSGFPYDGRVHIKIGELSAARAGTVPWNILVRQPSWTTGMHVTINGIPQLSHVSAQVSQNDAASGFDPRAASFHTLHRNWGAGDEIVIEFEMPILTRRANPKVKGHQGKVAITRGPLVYCLESVDNPDTDIFNIAMDTNSLEPVKISDQLGDIIQIRGISKKGKLLILIPYFLWGNRGSSRMTVWVNE